MQGLDIVAELLCEIIEEETGITVKPSDFGFDGKNDTLVVTLFDEELTQIDAHETDPEDLGYIITESVPRLREKITENRIASLEKKIETMIKTIDPEFTNKHTIRIENRGYLSRYRHYTTEAETDKDYPDMVLIVESEGKVTEYEVTPYNFSEPVDIHEIIG